MGWIKDLITATKGAINEAGDNAADSVAIQTLEQHIRDAEKELHAAKESETVVVAQRLAAERTVKDLTSKLTEHEGYALKALEQGNNELATEIAEKISSLENELESQKELLNSYKGQEQQILAAIKGSQKSLDSLKREVAVVKAQDKAQKAQAALASRYAGSNSSLSSAKSSLDRLKKKQQEQADRNKAALELERMESGGDLQAKMREAGILGEGSTANSVLERLKDKKSST